MAESSDLKMLKDSMRGMAAIILSAGTSSRMGDFKPLLPLGGKTVIERAVALFREAGAEDIRVVLGYRAHDVIPVLKPLGVQIVVNDQFTGEMFTSVKAGVGTLGKETSAFFLLPVDMPLVKLDTLVRLAAVYRQLSSDAVIVYPCYQGKRGHPPLISASYIPEILSWLRLDGMKGFLEEKESAAVEVAVADRGVIQDMDTPADYMTIKEGFEKTNALPGEGQCLAILTRHHVPDRIIRHGQTVARLAVGIASKLNEFGYRLDVDLIQAAALLHDIAKGRPNHAAAGAEILAGMDYPRIASIVASHMDFDAPPESEIEETAVVYLADKMVEGDRILSLASRQQRATSRFSSEPEALAHLEKKFKTAFQLKYRIEDVIGAGVETIIRNPTG